VLRIIQYNYNYDNEEINVKNNIFDYDFYNIKFV